MHKRQLSGTELADIVREAVDLLPGGFVIYGPDHEILLANASNERDFPITNKCLREGMTYREATRTSVEAVMPDLTHEQSTAAAEHIISTLERGESIEVKTPHGTIMQVMELPLSFGGSVAVGADITALRERERDLRKARKQADAASEAKSAFLANISHEIRTPLNGILGMTQLLAGGELTDEQRDQIETILDSGKTLMAILNDVLDLSKIEAGRFDISPIDNDLENLLRRLNKLWSPRAAEKGLDLELDIPKGVVSFLRFDPIRVRQCISNMVSNAIKFTERGKVTISTHVDHVADDVYEVRLMVSDTGMGMNQETQDRLFTPFTQADASTSRQFGGTGLGLSISRKLARLMGGDITVFSEEGKGATFTLSFRAARGKISEEAPMNKDADQTGGAHWPKGMAALLVDDHPLNRKVARLFLEPLGIEIIEAEHGEEALRLMAERRFDLVLLDMHMPVMDGPETLRRMRQDGSPFADIPVIALTADSLGPENARYDMMGAEGYIPKPIDHRQMIMEIGRVLEVKHGRAPQPSGLVMMRRG
jgi:signal transduction histidine kinase/ActR/RegA family two-component response regulator